MSWRQVMAGRGRKKITGKATKTKRTAQRRSGGRSRKATLMATKFVPQIETIRRARRRWRSGRAAADMREGVKVARARAAARSGAVTAGTVTRMGARYTVVVGASHGGRARRIVGARVE